MGEDNHEERPTKLCTLCLGREWRKTGVAHKFETGLVFIPTFRKCKRCDGWGYESMTIDEILFERECRRGF